MVGATDVVQPWMPRAARDGDACLWHVSIAGGARRRGCAAAGVSEFVSGPLEINDPQVGTSLLQKLSEHAAVADRGVGLEAQQRGGRRVVELGGERVELGRRSGLDVRAEGRRALRHAAGVEEEPQVGGGPELAS